MPKRPLNRLFATSAAALALAAAGAAHAGTNELTFTGTNVSGDVFAQTTGDDVTAIWGSITDADIGPGSFTITGLSPYASSDNTFNAGGPFVTLGGLSFKTAGGGDFNLADLDGYPGYSGYFFLSSTLDSGGSFSSVGMTSVTLAATAVPEAGNLALMATGLLALAAAQRWRRRVAR